MPCYVRGPIGDKDEKDMGLWLLGNTTDKERDYVSVCRGNSVTGCWSPHPPRPPPHPTPATAAGRWWAHMPSPSVVCDHVSTRGAAEKLPLYCTDKLQELVGKTPVLEMPILEEITEVI